MSIESFTAKRVTKGTKTVIAIYKDGALYHEMGGKIAERANAVLLTETGDNYAHMTPGHVTIHGLRSDIMKADAEAACFLNEIKQKTYRDAQGRTFARPVVTVHPPAYRAAKALRITEGA